MMFYMKWITNDEEQDVNEIFQGFLKKAVIALPILLIAAALFVAAVNGYVYEGVFELILWIVGWYLFWLFTICVGQLAFRECGKNLANISTVYLAGIVVFVAGCQLEVLGHVWIVYLLSFLVLLLLWGLFCVLVQKDHRFPLFIYGAYRVMIVVGLLMAIHGFLMWL